MLGMTFNNSPLYLAGLFVLLLIIWALKAPVKRRNVKFKKWLKKRKEENKKKKHKSIVPLVMEKKVGKGKVKIVNKKVFINDWSTPLFFVLGIGILIYSLFGGIDYLAKAFNQLRDFGFGFINNHIFTSIILAIFVSAIFVIVSDLFEFLQRRKYLVLRILSMFLFSVLIALSFIVFIRSMELSNLHIINSIIFGALFVLMGLVINYKRIFRNRDVQKKEEVEKESDEFIF